MTCFSHFAADADYVDLFETYLNEAVQNGERPAATAGVGAAASGQSQLWADWQKMNQKQKIAFLQEMARVSAGHHSHAQASQQALVILLSNSVSCRYAVFTPVPVSCV